MELAAGDSRPIVLQRERARRGQTGTLRWALPIDGTRPRHYRIPRSGLVQPVFLLFVRFAFAICHDLPRLILRFYYGVNPNACQLAGTE